MLKLSFWQLKVLVTRIIRLTIYVAYRIIRYPIRITNNFELNLIYGIETAELFGS